MRVNIDDLDWDKMDNLIPVVTQESNTKEILTLGFLNKEALEKTFETGYAYYYRRSHGKVMKKGVTSGNVQKIVKILTDCDNDAIVFIVEQNGPACHLGERTCFHKKVTRERSC
jgi:phosphoribosyl-AMP cyclohydrolase